MNNNILKKIIHSNINDDFFHKHLLHVNDKIIYSFNNNNNPNYKFRTNKHLGGAQDDPKRKKFAVVNDIFAKKITDLQQNLNARQSKVTQESIDDMTTKVQEIAKEVKDIANYIKQTNEFMEKQNLQNVVRQLEHINKKILEYVK